MKESSASPYPEKSLEAADGLGVAGALTTGVTVGVVYVATEELGSHFEAAALEEAAGVLVAT